MPPDSPAIAKFSPHPGRHGIGSASGMSTTTAAELSLINDTEFLEDPAHVGPVDPFGGLDAGLPVHATAPPFGAPLHDVSRWATTTTTARRRAGARGTRTSRS